MMTATTTDDGTALADSPSSLTASDALVAVALTELYTFELPTSFVVLQGIPGDGLNNTMDRLPVLKPSMDDTITTTTASAENNSNNNDGAGTTTIQAAAAAAHPPPVPPEKQVDATSGVALGGGIFGAISSVPATLPGISSIATAQRQVSHEAKPPADRASLQERKRQERRTENDDELEHFGTKTTGLVTPPDCSFRAALHTTAAKTAARSVNEVTRINDQDDSYIVLSDQDTFSSTPNLGLSSLSDASEVLEEGYTAINTSSTSTASSTVAALPSSLKPPPPSSQTPTAEVPTAKSQPRPQHQQQLSAGVALSRQSQPQRQQQQQQLGTSHEQQQQQHSVSSPGTLTQQDDVLGEWEKECRAQERLHQKEWREECKAAAEAARDSSSRAGGSPGGGGSSCRVASFNAAHASRLSNLVHEHGNDNTWWIRNGRLVVLPEPLSFVSVKVFSRDEEKKDRIKRLLVAPAVNHNLRTLSPGTVLVGTEMITLDAETHELLHHARPSPGASTTGTTTSRASPAAAATGAGTGRSGWLQLLKIESPREGYVAYSWNGYAYSVPGLPSRLQTPSVWMWRVTCPAGAVLRAGVDLSTRHLHTLPYGSFVHVKRKTFNTMGLSRLQVSAVVPAAEAKAVVAESSKKPADKKNDDSCSVADTVLISGWCSEFLNPLSGQRGSIVQPVPYPVPALYRVTLSEGAVIRAGIELSTAQIGNAPLDSIVCVTGRTFSEHPADKCIERLRLAGNGGWISLRLNKPPPADRLVVELLGIDGSFDPDRPGAFHLEAQRRVQRDQQRQVQQQRGGGGLQGSGLSRSSSHGSSGRIPADISSIDDEDAASDSSLSGSNNNNNDNGNVVPRRNQQQQEGQTGPLAPTSCNYSGVARPMPGGSRQSYDDRCLICLMKERNATIVHGETGHIACCLSCARILKARRDLCPVCRLPIDLVIQHFWA